MCSLTSYSLSFSQRPLLTVIDMRPCIVLAILALTATSVRYVRLSLPTGGRSPAPTGLLPRSPHLVLLHPRARPPQRCARPPQRARPLRRARPPPPPRKAPPRPAARKPKITMGKLVNHVTAAAGAAEAVGNAVQAFKGGAQATEELAQRELYDEVYARALEEVYAREEGLYVREEGLNAREEGLYAREEELFAREFLEDAGLEEREYEDAHWARE
ncbi:hypothetical protein C8Q72DRAFT_280413 [Fomitopsis betulina]|nr:hypothetical protein C8Q72DRAFT_280413 [Fomitopsis betulina]